MPPRLPVVAGARRGQCVAGGKRGQKRNGVVVAFPLVSVALWRLPTARSPFPVSRVSVVLSGLGGTDGALPSAGSQSSTSSISGVDSLVAFKIEMGPAYD